MIRKQKSLVILCVCNFLSLYFGLVLIIILPATWKCVEVLCVKVRDRRKSLFVAERSAKTTLWQKVLSA